MKIAYKLRDDPKHIAQVQKATLTTDDFGIEPTDGLFGSPEWWDRIANGVGFWLLAVVCLKPSKAPVQERTANLGFYRDSIVTKTETVAEVGVPLSRVFELDVMHKALKLHAVLMQ